MHVFVVSLLLIEGMILPADEKVDKILKKMEDRYATTEALSCRYQQTENIRQLTAEIQLEGKLYFRKPHFIMMEMRGDENLNLYVNGEKIWIEDLDLDEVESYDFHLLNGNNRITRFLPPLFLNSIQDLKEWFDISLVHTSGGKNRLELRPKSKDTFQFEFIQFDIDSLGRIPWMKVKYDDANYKEMKFWDWQKIPKTSKYFFQYRGDAKKK